MLLLGGCAPKPKAQVVPEKKESPPQVVHSGPATFDKLGPHGEKLWTVSWQSATASIFDHGEFAGEIDNVEGSIYQGGRVVSTFRGDRGDIERNSNDFTLEGSVLVRSVQNRAVLHCDRMEYHEHQKEIRAKGAVAVTSPNGRLDGIQELCTNLDLKVVATPDMWSPQP